MNFTDHAANFGVSYVYSNCLLHLLPHLLYCRGLWGRSMCQWTTVTPGTWPSCPLLVMSSSTPFWPPMMKWSSCMLMSQEVSWHRNYLSSLFWIIQEDIGVLTREVCVCGFADSGFGTIYVSDDRGTVYSKSLEHHLYTTTGGETDFINVTSLRGVFTTSILAEGIYVVVETW